jgi:putative ABC transport system ATP-binding protein
MHRVSWPLRPADRPSPSGPDPRAVRPPPPATFTELGPSIGARPSAATAAAADPVAPAIELRSVVKDYETAAGRIRALKDVDLEVRRGEFLAVVGRSASGKSTLMNMIAGIDRPTAGEVRVAGTRVDLLGEGELAAWRGRHLGIVFQFFQLLPTLTVLENVLIAMDFAGWIPGAERNDRAAMLLEQVGMADQAKRFPAAISGGQQQRVAIARALANDPPAIVADEPTGNLDAATADVVFDLLGARAATGRTIVMVTHDNDLAARTSRIVHLVDGVMGDGMLPDEATG